MHIQKTVTVSRLYQTNKRFVTVSLVCRESRPSEKYPDHKEDVVELDIHMAPGEEPRIGEEFIMTLERKL